MIPFCLSVSFNVPKERGSHVVLVRNSFLWSFTRCWFKSLDTSENMCEKNGKMKPYGVSCLWNRLVVIMDDLSKRNLNSSLSPSLFSLKRCLFLWAMRKNTEIYQDWNRISSVCCPFFYDAHWNDQKEINEMWTHCFSHWTAKWLGVKCSYIRHKSGRFSCCIWLSSSHPHALFSLLHICSW